ncbi:NTP transferase domain-containing protein [Amaricoccus macauensis]|uniref:NTP transferase domain-containing protein n=1 Tax=Amaricoccus macauensis TaxID=57001 RepID=UPI003C7BBBD2
MKFGPVAARSAEGAILAHSLSFGRRKLRKGRVLGAAEVAELVAAGVEEVAVARLEAGDLGEDEAAARIAACLRADGLDVSAPFTGRVNLFAGAAGICAVDRAAVDALNRIDPAITLATVPEWSRVQARQMVATVKIIPYGVPGALVDRAVAAMRPGTLALHPFEPTTAALILTRTPGMKESLLRKGAEVVAARMEALGVQLGASVTVAHETGAVAAALRAAQGDLVLILGASATSDPEDTCPSAVTAAGGTLERFGMPVDPGNLLFLGRHAGRHVVGLPGCARSPALNGADWVLERLVAGLEVTDAAIAGMGVGGLLKEIPQRPQPRAARSRSVVSRPKVAALVLGAGAGRRMRGADKLLEDAGGQPMLARSVRAALESAASEVIAVIPAGHEARKAALAGLDVRVVETALCREGMAGSLRAGLAAIPDAADAVVILLADMPEVGPGHVDRLIAAFDPVEGREICRAVTEAGKPGHPVLFGRRFFESLAGLTGDRGARDIVRASAEFIVDVPTEGEAAVIDLDTPEAWAAWRAETEAAR